MEVRQILRYMKWYKIIKNSNIFDERYYLFTYEDIRLRDVDPILHYIRYGANEGRNPSENFNTKYYLHTYDDVKRSCINPLVHYILYGNKEGRKQQENSKKQTSTHQHTKQLPTLHKIERYEAWQQVNQLSHNRKELLLSCLHKASYHPTLSIIIPVYNPLLTFLEQAVQSVVSQIYTQWEICIVDDRSTHSYVKSYLENLQRQYPNITCIFNDTNRHISEATNRAVSIASGEYLVFLDQDDLLTEDALAEIVLYLNKDSDIELLYSDDDKIDVNNHRFDLQFKPDWSPEYLLSFMYCGHVKCVKKSLYTELGGFRQGFEGSQDYDFFLRASEKAAGIAHIPRVLYHWRVVPGSTAAGGENKNYSFEAGIKAVEETLQRRSVKAEVYQPQWALKNGNGIYALRFPDEGKSVAIIIPTKNGYELLKQCIDSLKKTTYQNYKIYIVNNESDDSKTLNYLKSLKHGTIFNITNPNGEFSFSYINNRAVEQVTEELVLFLNNDIEVINAQWLSQMVGYLQFSGVGSVGARLIFPDNRIQHAGIIHGMTHGFPITSGRLLPDWQWGYLASTVTSKNFAAVTAACMLTPKKLFQDLGGFDDIDFSIAFNDCDYGYKLYNAGYRNVLAPEAQLYHHEGASRGHGDKPHEESAYIRKYGQWRDPYYNPNLAKNCSDYAIDSKTVLLHKIPKFRLLMVTHNLNLEGAPKSFYELAKSLKKDGEIEPVVLSHTDGPLLKLYEKEGIDIQVIEGFNLFNVNTEEQVDNFLQKQKEYIDSLHVDVIYGNTIEAAWAMKCAKLLALPCVWNIRESEVPFSSYNHNMKIKNLMIESVAYPYRVIFVADATKKVYEPLNTQHNFITIYNGFDKELADRHTEGLSQDVLRKELGIRQHELGILILGTVCERKGQIDLLMAIDMLDQRVVEKIRIFIVGDRKSLPYSQKMHEYLRQLPEEKRDRVTVIDETMDVYKYYMANDIFVCASRVESFPKVIQEAMYYHLAIITTPVFGIVEQVKDGTSALYYAPEDIQKLVQNLCLLIEDTQMRKTLANNAKAALDILPTIEEMGLAYKEVFQEAWLSGTSR